MARLESLSILTEGGGKDFLAETYGKTIENFQKATISHKMKNTDLSGDPTSGSVEAKRFANAASADYGTARAAGKGKSIKAKPVTVKIDINKEIVEEIEKKDTMTYGVDGLIEKRAAKHPLTMARETERAFFKKAADNAIEVTPAAGANIVETAESLVLQLEETQNDYVDGVDRSLISMVLSPTKYSVMRNFLNIGVNNASVNSAAEEFFSYNGVKYYSSVYLPAGVSMLGMVDGAVAMPILPTPYEAERIGLSQAYAIELFYSYGVEAVMPDLIVKLAE